MRLKLIKDNIQTTSNSHAWDLMWKNVYTMGSSNIDLSTLNVASVESSSLERNIARLAFSSIPPDPLKSVSLGFLDSFELSLLS